MAQQPAESQVSYFPPGLDNYQKLARRVTDATSPVILAIPTFIILAIFDQNRLGPTYNPGLSLGLALLFGVILPIVMVLALVSLQKIGSLHIPVRQERYLPYLLAILIYGVGTLVLDLSVGICMITALMGCYTINAVIIMIINFWWKISAHLTGVGGPLAALTLVIGWWVVPLFSLFVIVGWARLYLKAHTLGQVIAGGFFGYGFTLLELLILFRVAWQ